MNNKTDRLVSSDTAKIAKDLGFNYPTCARYDDQYQNDWTLAPPSTWFEGNHQGTLTMSAPSQSQLSKWLREEHMIFLSITRESIGSDEWVFGYIVEWLPKEHWDEKRRSGFFKDTKSFVESPGGTYWGGWDSYEEAMENGLIKSLSIIKGT